MVCKKVRIAKRLFDSQLGSIGLFNLGTSFPKVVGNCTGNYGQCDSKLAGKVAGRTRINRNPVENGLDKKIVAGMKNDAGPETA